MIMCAHHCALICFASIINAHSRVFKGWDLFFGQQSCVNITTDKYQTATFGFQGFKKKSVNLLI